MKKYKKGFRFLKVAVITLTAFFLLMVIILANSTENTTIKKTRSDENCTQVYTYSYIEVEQEDAPIGIGEEYSFRVPVDLACDTYLTFYLQQQFVQVYLDDECIYSMMPSVNFHRIKTPGCSWVSVPVFREDAGKEIRAVVTPVYQSTLEEPVEFMFATKETLMLKQLKKDAVPVIICILLIFSEIIMLAFSLYSHKVYKQGLDIISYSILSICIGIWRGLDLHFTSFILSEKPVLRFYASMGAMMGGMIPFVLAQRKRIGLKLADSYTVGVALIYSTICVLQLAGIADFLEFILIIQIIMLVGFLNLLVMELIHQKKNHSGISVELIISLLLIVGAVLDFSIYHIKRNSVASNFLLVMQFVTILVNEFYYTQNYGRQAQNLVTQENQIIKSRLTVLAGQIRSHFVYNILNDISGMCKYDPKGADQAIICFARYLRTNIDIMQEDEPVLFQTALTHLENYWELVQIRYKNKFHLVY